MLKRGVVTGEALAALRAEADRLAAREAPSFENGCVLETVVEWGDGETWRTDRAEYAERRFGGGFSDDDGLSQLVFATLPSLCGYGYLFNEQYVVKPAKSDITFRWHRDRDEQLVDDYSEVDYASCWVALDDCDETNGCLELRGKGPVVCEAGDVVLMDSRCEHRSGPNAGDEPRRAFYAQYSSEPIRVPRGVRGPGVRGPAGESFFQILRLAIPCDDFSPSPTTTTTRTTPGRLKNDDTLGALVSSARSSEDWSRADEAWALVLKECWRQLHDPTRHWSEAPVECRRVYEAAALGRVEALRNLGRRGENRVRILDLALMLGDGTRRADLLKAIDDEEAAAEQPPAKVPRRLSSSSSSRKSEKSVKTTEAFEEEDPCRSDDGRSRGRRRRPLTGTSPVPVQETPPSVETFRVSFFAVRKPTVMRGLLDKWPALGKWKDVSYFRRFGHRIVPVEFGEHYLDEGSFEEKLLTFDEFLDHLERDDDDDDKRKVYLAQHALFDQIPALRNDVGMPAYCALGDWNADDDDDDTSTTTTSTPRLNAWFGPAGTKSPLHHDRYHNLLCQVVGSKYVRLYAPHETSRLYPREGLHAVSSHVVDLDDDHTISTHFPLFKEAPYLDTHLNAGEVLYIPPGTWHYVEANETSFSVSFWWW